MERTKQGMLDGRSVELRRVGIGCGFEAADVREKTGNQTRAGFVILAESAHWLDTGERIWKDAADVMRWPLPDVNEVMELSNLASELNSPRAAREQTTQPGTNGSGEPAGPSH